MPRWAEGLVNAFPIPEDHELSLSKLRISKARRLPAPVITDDSDPLPFFNLPGEIRNRIYNLVLFSKPEYRRADGTRDSRLAVLFASKKFYREASYVLYTTHKFLVFPLQQFNPIPTIRDLPLHYQVLVTNLEIKIGSSWTSPPSSWRVSKGLERVLKRLKNVQTLTIFVELDPSDPILKIKKHIHEAYVDFCVDLVEDVIEAMPKVSYIRLDGNPGVNKHGPLVSRLREAAEAQNKTITWGRQDDWVYTVDQNSSLEE